AAGLGAPAGTLSPSPLARLAAGRGRAPRGGLPARRLLPRDARLRGPRGDVLARRGPLRLHAGAGGLALGLHGPRGGARPGPARGGFIFGRFEAPATYRAAAVCAVGALGLSLLGARPGGQAEAQVIRARRSG